MVRTSLVPKKVPNSTPAGDLGAHSPHLGYPRQLRDCVPWTKVALFLSYLILVHSVMSIRLYLFLEILFAVVFFMLVEALQLDTQLITSRKKNNPWQM